MNKYIDLEGYGFSQRKLKEYISETIGTAFAEHIIQEDTFLKFPTIGNEHGVYIDTSTNSIYRWDSDHLKYYVVVDSWKNIQVINCSHDI